MSAVEEPKRDAMGRKARPIPIVTQIGVAGFKSFGELTTAGVRPLTILAGVNSSGKSSLMQPLLLLKQTLDATFDPGPLKLDGPNVTFSSGNQFFSRVTDSADELRIAVDLDSEDWRVEPPSAYSFRIAIAFGADNADAVRVHEFTSSRYSATVMARPDMTIKELREQFNPYFPLDPVGERWQADLFDTVGEEYRAPTDEDFLFSFERFLPRFHKMLESGISVREHFSQWTDPLERFLAHVIHVPGLRGNPQRAYQRSSIGPTFPGTFEEYTASILYHWQEADRNALQIVAKDLRELGLTWKVDVGKIDQTQLEIKVGRLLKAARGGGKDVVNIADLGFGVSQVLPVVVALRTARAGQLVYVEQPELHLHPRAAGQMSTLLADAASRGVRVVAETHSQELLLGVQTLVAEGKLDPALVKLHWFARAPDGSSTITSTDLDESGAFGDWPEDFSDVSLQLQSRYLDAAESKLAERATQ